MHFVSEVVIKIHVNQKLQFLFFRQNFNFQFFQIRVFIPLISSPQTKNIFLFGRLLERLGWGGGCVFYLIGGIGVRG